MEAIKIFVGTSMMFAGLISLFTGMMFTSLEPKGSVMYRKGYLMVSVSLIVFFFGLLILPLSI